MVRSDPMAVGANKVAFGKFCQEAGSEASVQEVTNSKRLAPRLGVIEVHSHWREAPTTIGAWTILHGVQSGAALVVAPCCNDTGALKGLWSL